MRYSITRHCLPVLLALALGHGAAAGAPPPQTQPWRIGIAGAWPTGYLGLLALHGLPRERIDDNDIDSLDKLKQYDIIIIGARGGGAAAAKMIEEYVRAGGIALTETSPVPTAEAVPGRRVGPLAAPNLRFVDSGTPVTAGCPALGVIPAGGLTGYSIIPESPDVKVLARFTDEGAPQRTLGNFVGSDGQGMPAILMIPLGEGVWFHAGASLSWLISMPPGTRGRTMIADESVARPLEPFLMNLLRYVSWGELADRMVPHEVPPSELATQRSPEPPTTYPTPPGAAQEPPASYEVLDDPANLQDFVLTGQLLASGEMHLLISYWSPQSYRELVISKGQATLNRCAGGKSDTLATAPMPQNANALLIMRRHGLLTLKANHRLVLAACDGPALQGALAAKGLTDPAYQPLDAVDFSDDFMRETAGTDEWTQKQGTWRITASEGKPGMGANPFDYEVDAADKAISINGEWFWSDYRYEVRVKTSGAAAGIIANYRNESNYVLLRLQPGPSGKLQLLRFQDGQPKTLAETAVTAAPADWHKLGLCTSHGVIAAALDGRTKLQVYQPDQPIGQIGLYCEKGHGCFDHVLVKPWVACGSDEDVRQMRAAGGQWRSEAGVIYGAGSDGASLLAPWDCSGDSRASVSVKLGGAASAGLHVRYAGANKYYLLALVSEGGGARVRLSRGGNPMAVLAEQPLRGAAGDWHKLALVVQDCRVSAYVDDVLLTNRLDTGHQNGDVGLYSRGAQAACFRDFQATAVEDDENLVDELTPHFAGIIDQHTWAGRSGAWVADPEALDTFWHTGYFPGTIHLQAGLHPGGEPACRTTLYLARGYDKNAYAVEASHNWAGETVSLAVYRAGEKVAAAEPRVKPGKPFSVGLFRAGSQLLVEINGAPVTMFVDHEPLPNPDSLGIENHGGLLVADDLHVTTPDVHDYTFEAAPTDWMIESGTWEISSRWSCTPGWAWFSGFNSDGYAAITTKQAYSGDQEVVIYVAAKMMPAPGGKHTEKLTDINVGLLVRETSRDSGYQFVLGGMNNTKTVLLRDGVEVVSSPYRLPQAGLHNDWTKVTLRRHDNRVECWVWDTLVMQYDDMAPLSAGRVSVGTYQNGIIVPRITIFGKQVP